MQTSHSAANRLVLGTVQLGLPYGIANQVGQPDIRTAEAIVETAWQGGIREFDTAQGYGESEKVLGGIIQRLGVGGQARIISKISPGPDQLAPSALRQALEESLERLGISNLHGVMLHKEELLDHWDKGLGETLSTWVASGLVEHIGVSVYSPRKALDALRIDGITTVQVPSNILDRRFENAGVFQLAESELKVVFVRSVFLQGLLLMDIEDLPPSMLFASRTLGTFKSLAEKVGVSRQHLALGYSREAYPNAKILFGAETPEQVRTNLLRWGNALPEWVVTEAKETFRDVQKDILNPSLWPL
ncbi:MAG: aldo/keto reductase [Chloroflexi bacterium]|nr:aldo/keto reductase [Chloroflexota bacterium]